MLTIKFDDASIARIKKAMEDAIQRILQERHYLMPLKLRDGIAPSDRFHNEINFQSYPSFNPPPDPGGYFAMGMDSMDARLNTRRHVVTKAKMLEAVLAEIPLPQQIREIDITSEENAVRFTWRDQRFRVQDQLVEEIVDGMRSGSNTAILLAALIKRK